MTRTELYMEYLTEEGFRPKLDEEGDIVFKSEGKTYVLFASAGDEQLFRLGALWIWPIESEEERQRALEAAADATCTLKVAKVYPVNDNIWATVEMLFEQPEHFRGVFPRALALVQAGVSRFNVKMRRTAPDTPVVQE
jgi:hypothetical protein